MINLMNNMGKQSYFSTNLEEQKGGTREERFALEHTTEHCEGSQQVVQVDKGEKKSFNKLFF